MRQLLIINPNTSAGVTQRLQSIAQAQAPAGWGVESVQARFGAHYISGEMAAAVAAHAALEALAEHLQRRGTPDAVLLACFGDPGLFALRSGTTAPVLGLAEAAMRAAARQGPYAIVTGGAAWVPMLERHARALELNTGLCGVLAVSSNGGQLAADPQAAQAALHAACEEALARWPAARAILLGGAGLAGMAAPLAARLPVPVLDNVLLALDSVWALPCAAAAAAAVPEPGPWIGLGPALDSHLAGGQGVTDSLRALGTSLADS
jgi:Asp/Glu/hydantoin racemase